MAHIEKERRKKRNHAERKRLLAELKATGGKDKTTNDIEDIEMDAVAEEQSDDGESSEEQLSDVDDDEGIAGSGNDKLASSTKLDIPRASNIPIVSELARERAREMRELKPALEVR